MRFSLRKREAPSLEERAITWLPWWDKGMDGPGTSTHSGASVDEESALKFSAVYAAATLIADAVASLPAEAFVGGKPADLPKWIRAPHPEMRRFDVFNQLALSVLLWGNAYAQFVRRPSDGVAIGLLVLHPKRVHVEWADALGMQRRYSVDGGPWMYKDDVLHVQGPTLPGAVKGLSVIAMARESIALGLTLEEFGARYFGQGSMAKIVLEVGNLPAGAEGEKKATEIVRIFEKFHRGRRNWHRPAVMSGGKIHNISIPPEDAQFLQSREFQAIDVARWFRVPPHRIGIVSKQSSWGSGLAEENTAMVQHTFKPWILRFEETLSAYAPGPEGLGMIIRLVDAGLLRGTAKEQADLWTMLYEKKVATKNEARKALGLPEVPDGEEFAADAAPVAAATPDKPESQSSTPGPRDEDGKPTRSADPTDAEIAEIRKRFTEAREKRAAKLHKVTRSVSKVGDNCPQCQRNSDPANLPVHPGCNCDAVTDEVETGMDEAEFSYHRDTRMTPDLGTAARLLLSDMRYGDVDRWSQQVTPSLGSDSVTTLIVDDLDGEAVLVVQRAAADTFDFGEKKWLLLSSDSRHVRTYVLSAAAGPDDFREVYGEIQKEGS